MCTLSTLQSDCRTLHVGRKSGGQRHSQGCSLHNRPNPIPTLNGVSRQPRRCSGCSMEEPRCGDGVVGPSSSSRRIGRGARDVFNLARWANVLRLLSGCRHAHAESAVGSASMRWLRRADLCSEEIANRTAQNLYPLHRSVRVTDPPK